MSFKKYNPFKDFQSDLIQRSSRKIFTACRNADLNLTLDREILVEFIVEASYPSRRIFRQTDNSSKYNKSEDEFCSIICLDTLSGKRPRKTGNIAKI